MIAILFSCDGDAENVEELSGAVAVRVLVEDALARTTPQLLRLGRVVEQRAVRVDRLGGALGDEQLRAGLEPPLDPLVRVRHDRGAGRGELERPARRRCVDGGVRPARDAQVDARGGDGARERVERNIADLPRCADVAAKIAAAEREIDVGQRARRLTDHRLHPLAPELVAVAVEENVRLRIDGLRREELRIGRPEDRLSATGAELAQAVEPALGVRDEEVVLGGIGVVVPVEARVHAAELGRLIGTSPS